MSRAKTVPLVPLQPVRPTPPRSRDNQAITRAVLTAALLTACSGGSDLLLPGDGQPAAIAVVQGDSQSGRVGEPLADPVVVEVTDSRGRPVEGAKVAFELTPASPGAEIAPPSATTDANGQANTRMILGTTVGAQTGQARVVIGSGDHAPQTSFTAMALPTGANGIATVSGDGQTGPAGSTLHDPLVVEVTDAFGNPISGVTVNWTAEGGGSVSNASVTTDGQGRASVERTLGSSAGQQTTLASSEGLAGSPVTFTHTATAGNASSLTIVSGNNQTAAAGTRLPADLVVRLVDPGGNGVLGEAVTWVVGTGGGRVTPQNGITNSAGRASAQWTLGPGPGDNRVDAVVSGVGIVTFTASGTAGAPAALFIRDQPSSSARNGVRFDRQPVVQLRDAQGNDVATGGIEVTAQIGGGGGDLFGTRRKTTDANGHATFTDLAITGAPGRRTLVFTASGYAGATSNEIDVRAVTTATTIMSDLPDPSAPGAAFTVEFRVSSEGPTPTGTVTVTVTDGTPTCSGTLQNGSGSCALTLISEGTRTLQATYPGGPGLNPSSATAPHRVQAAPPLNRAPKADYNWHCNGLACSFTDKSKDSDGTVVAWSWAFGDGGTSTDQNPQHSYSAAGTYTVTLTATDNGGATDQASAAVKVEALPPPPPGGTTTTITGDAPDPSEQGAAITVSFTVTSASGTPSGTVQVTDPNGGSCTGSAPSGSCTLTPGGVGSRTLTATYQGNSSFSGSSGTAEHTVNPANSPPTAAFNSPSCTAGQPCAFIDGSSDTDGTVVGWSWTFGDNASSAEKNPSHTYTVGGTYAVTLTVTDNKGANSAPVSHNVTVNTPPTAAFSAPNCTQGVSCAFADGSSDPDGTVVGWSWTFGDGGTSNEKNPLHTYIAAGSFPVTLTVTDNAGASSTPLSQNVTVAPNQPPTAAFTFDACPGLTCTFTDQSTDDGTIVSWSWDFGDPASPTNTSTDKNPVHLFTAAGPYTVTLTVTDNGALTSTVAHVVTVP